MNYRAIARPYAKALFENAAAQNKLESGFFAINTLAEIAKNPQMAILLKQPGIDPDFLINLFEELAKDVLDAELLAFIKLLAKAKRLMVLEDIQSLYAEFLLAHLQKRHVKVTSAFSLTKMEMQILSEKLQKKFKQELDIVYEVDPALVGGFYVESDGQVIDASVRGRIKALAEDLLRTA